MNLNEKINYILELDTYAKEIGGFQTCLVLAKDIIVDERVRMQCQVNLCGNYRNNLMCPPFLPSLPDCRVLISKYSFVLLLQLHKSVPSKCQAEYREVFTNTALQFNEWLFSLERKAFLGGFPLALALGAGECKLCENCVAKNGLTQCLKPGSSRPSMEGMGIDVLRTFQAAGLAMDFIEGKMTIGGMLLID